MVARPKVGSYLAEDNYVCFYYWNKIWQQSCD